MTLHEKLKQAQSKLLVPKGQKNTFGNYNYRSAEDIMKALKPIQEELNFVTVSNIEIITVSDRVYVEATATMHDLESNAQISAKAYAREDDVKKGMDGSQITGAAISYARKYALAGLFQIDNEKDADATNRQATENRRNPKASKPVDDPFADDPFSEPLIGTDEAMNIKGYLKQLPNKNYEQRMFAKYGITKIEDLTQEQYAEAVRYFQSELTHAQAD